MSNLYPGERDGPLQYPSSTSRVPRRPSYATVVAGRPVITDAALTGEAHSTYYPPPSGHSRADLNNMASAHTYPNSNEQSPATVRRLGTSGGASIHDRRGSSTWGGTDTIRYDRLGCTEHDDHPVFFTPSYLQSSRHVQRLRQANEQHLAELQEYARNTSLSKPPSLSASSSNVNLNKLHTSHSSHRGVVHDVIERLPPPHVDDDRLHPLPTRWSDDDKLNGLDIMADGVEVRFSGVTKNSDEAAAIRSDYPMPKECGIYYFEVTILSRGKDGLIGIGFSSKKANLNRLPGWEIESWAYHGDDGYVFACTSSGKAYGPRFAAQDVIGCGVNFRTNSAFFTKNGNFLGTAFHNVRGDRLYPSVGMKKPGEHLRVNFGKTPFVFDIDKMVEKERSSILADISKTDVSNLHPPDNEATLIHNLIGQYLAHEGYVETAKAFARDVHERQQSLQDRSQPVAFVDDEDIHAVNRQKIRRSILDGDIDRALKYTNSYFPRLFQEDRNRDIYFRLRCQKFIEMMRRHSGSGNTANSSPTTVTKSVDSLGSNGHTTTVPNDQEDDQDDTQMELDNQLHREVSLTAPSNDDPNSLDIDMTTSHSTLPPLQPSFPKDLLQSAIQYGTTLQSDFGTDRRPHVQKTLQDIFASVAYVDAVNSPIVGHVFDVKGRGTLAEEVNGAILVGLGKSCEAALEKVAAQTDALLDEMAGRSGGGAGALVNVKRDFLGE